MIKAVIIDDEEKSRKLLRNMLKTYCHEVDVLGLADSVQSGVEKIQRYQPDLIFLDIVMPNENGFELLNQIETVDCDIIFTTAYHEFAIKAIRACAIDYLLKPIDVDELRDAVGRVRTKLSQPAEAAVSDERLKNFLEHIQPEKPPARKIGLPTTNGVKFYPIERITFCKAEGNYITVHFDRDKPELVSKTLKEFDELLSDFGFIRTHRSYLVNLKHLCEYLRDTRNEADGGCVVLAGGVKVPVSREKRKILMEKISRPF